MGLLCENVDRFLDSRHNHLVFPHSVSLTPCAQPPFLPTSALSHSQSFIPTSYWSSLAIDQAGICACSHPLALFPFASRFLTCYDSRKRHTRSLAPEKTRHASTSPALQRLGTREGRGVGALQGAPSRSAIVLNEVE